MHPNPAFRRVAAEHSLDLIRARSFGILTVGASEGPLASHIPFLLSDDAAQVEFHLVRNSPMARALEEGALGDGAAVRLIVEGPEGYVSPDWYGAEDQVPTWNYAAVHLTGRARLAPEVDFHALLDRLSAHFEDRLRPKTPWVSSKMSEGVMDRMMRGIVPCLMAVNDIQATWKLGQNKPDEVRRAAAAGLEGVGNGALAALMRDPPG